MTPPSQGQAFGALLAEAWTQAVLNSPSRDLAAVGKSKGQVDGMNSRPRALVLSGSTRADSYNTRLARLAEDAIRSRGVETTFVNLRDFRLPLFDEDLERDQGMPVPAQKLKDLFVSHDGFFIASPEYNSSITAILKNAIDWMSRRPAQEPPLIAFTGKVAAISSASPGALGGLRGLVHLRAILGNLNVVLVPEQVAVVKAHEAFDDGGNLKDSGTKAMFELVIERFAHLLERYTRPEQKR